MTLMLGACGPVEGSEPTPASELPSVARQALVGAEAVDPRLSPEVEVSPDSSVTQVVPAVAHAGDIALMVWHEFVPGTMPDIVGVRVRVSDGAVLDARPLRIATGDGVQIIPSVASNGRDFLVVWQEMSMGPPTVYGRRVRASDGAMLGAPFVVSKGNPMGPPHFTPSVAYGDGIYLVTWMGYSFLPTGGVGVGFQGIRVRASDGQVLDPHAFLIAPALDRSGTVTVPSVGYAAGRFLVAWADGTPQRRLYARRYGVNGAALDPAPYVLGESANYILAPTIASDGSDFLVAWGDAGLNLRGARVRGTDGAVLGGSGFLVGTSLNGRPKLSFDGSDYRLVWVQKGADALTLRATRVSPDGTVAEGADIVVSSQPLSSQLSSGALASVGRGRFLVGYQKPTSSGLSHVFTRRVVDLPNGEACTQAEECQSGSCVDGVCCESACGGGVGTDCQACSVAAGGQSDGACTVVRAEAQVVCRGAAVACDAAEVCDGASAECPADEPSASEPDLSGDKCEDSPCDVAAYVSMLGVQSLTVKAEGACQSWQRGNVEATRGQLGALLNQVQAQSGRKLDAQLADTLAAALSNMVGAL